MNTAIKVGLTTLTITGGALVVYVTKECIKEYNKVVDENDRLREYIANELINHDCKVDTILSNGKVIQHEPKVEVKKISTVNESKCSIEEFSNGFKLYTFKKKGA